MGLLSRFREGCVQPKYAMSHPGLLRNLPKIWLSDPLPRMSRKIVISYSAREEDLTLSMRFGYSAHKRMIQRNINILSADGECLNIACWTVLSATFLKAEILTFLRLVPRKLRVLERLNAFARKPGDIPNLLWCNLSEVETGLPLLPPLELRRDLLL